MNLIKHFYSSHQKQKPIVVGDKHNETQFIKPINQSINQSSKGVYFLKSFRKLNNHIFSFFFLSCVCVCVCGVVCARA